MSSLFSRRDKVDVPPARAPREGGRTRMAGERPSRTRRRRSEERQRSIEKALEKRRRGRRSRRRGEEERSRSRSRGLVGERRKNFQSPKDKGSEVVLDTFMGTGGRRSDPRSPRPEGGSGPRRDPGREKVYHPIVKSKAEGKKTADSSALIGRRLGTTPTGKRDGDPRPDRDRNRGRRRVRDEAFERRRRGGSPRRISREERRRRVRVANTRK